MGQYYLIVNLTKKQFLHPHKFGDGLKLMEFGGSGSGTMLGLAVLLASGNGRGGGDLHSENPIIGTWAGDKIVIAGDYDDEGKFVRGKRNLFFVAEEKYEDISAKVIEALMDDSYYKNNFLESYKDSWEGSSFRETIDNILNK